MLAGRSRAAGKPRGTSSAGRARESRADMPPRAASPRCRGQLRQLPPRRPASGSARLTIARPIFGPVGEQVEPCHRVAVALLAAHQLERLLQAVGAVDVGAPPREPASGSARSVACTITPVRPMPPSVA